jgi:uncharacterized membrane protein (UPF0127 family)
MTKYFVGLLFCVSIACSPKKESPVVAETKPPVDGSSQSARTVPLSAYGRATLSVGKNKIDVYVADEIAEQQDGLMFVKHGELAQDEGMVFVFGESEPRSFWMRNTLLPLDIAYLDDNGRILNIRLMQPLDESPQPSAGAARYAVEMHGGWFAEHGVKAGDKFDLKGLSE